MNCQQTREAIDSGANRAILAAHLDGCAGCESHLREFNSLLALLRQQPRVEAPSDFEFRVRAGIARAKAEESAPAGFSLGLRRLGDRIFSGSLSWVQATAATAALAAAVTFTATYFGQADHATSPVGSTDRLAAAQPSNGIASGDVLTASPAGSVVASLDSTPSAVVPTEVASRSDRGTETARALAVVTAETTDADSATSAVSSSMKVFNAEQGQMISASSQMTLIGAEVSSPMNGQTSRGVGYVPSI